MKIAKICLLMSLFGAQFIKADPLCSLALFLAAYERRHPNFATNLATLVRDPLCALCMASKVSGKEERGLSFLTSGFLVGSALYGPLYWALKSSYAEEIQLAEWSEKLLLLMREDFPNFIAGLKAEEKRKIDFQTFLNDFIGTIPEEVSILVDFLKNPSKYSEKGISHFSKGILFYGAPGTGKTLLARAIAHEAGVDFFPTSVQHLLSKWQGESEQNIANLFEKARKAAQDHEKPFSIIFIDEIDAIGGERQGRESDSVVNALLTEMDGFTRDEKVVVIAATNKKDSLDAALVRGGRFDNKIEIPLPDKDGREKLFRFYLNKYKFEKMPKDSLIAKLSEQSDNFSPADIEALISSAALRATYENKEEITKELLFEELSKFKKNHQSEVSSFMYS